MDKYDRIKKVCDENSKLTAKLVDKFLIYHAAAHDNLEKVMQRDFARYSRAAAKLPASWDSMAKAQYLAHRVFREDGLIRKFLYHSALKKLTSDEMKFLEFQADNPWRFSFSTITANPAGDFYLMEDVFRGNDFLLYSPAVTETLKTQRVALWLTLVTFNGSCWQTYGPVNPFNGFEPDDIYFFATEVNADIDNELDLIAEVEANPVPFMLLITGSTLPILISKNYRILLVMAEYDIPNLDTPNLAGQFKSAYSHGVYRLTLKRWGTHPHFAEAWYDENKNTLLLTAMTDRGFAELIKVLAEYGLELDAEPDLRVNQTMLKVASDILGRKIGLPDYRHLFQKDISAEKQQELDNLNMLLNLAMPDINAGKEPDYRSIAAKTGMDPESVKDILQQVTEHINKLKGPAKR
jgi:hypothetical protein